MSRETGAGPLRFGDLGTRLVSGLALALLALLVLWLGGLWIAVLAALAGALILWELDRMIGGAVLGRKRLVVAVVFGAGGILLTGVAGIGPGALWLAVGAAVAAGMARPRPPWLAATLVYVGFALAYLIVIRDDPHWGLAGVLWLILVVVAADVGAYFAGRSLGGPKLWPRVSPGKTWSGAAGGLLAAGALGLVFALLVGWSPASVAAISLGVAIASQAGDLLESAVKRRWAVKDSSGLIPGHGGVMDRLDGLIGGLWFFALYDMVGGIFGG